MDYEIKIKDEVIHLKVFSKEKTIILSKEFSWESLGFFRFILDGVLYSEENTREFLYKKAHKCAKDYIKQASIYEKTLED